MAKKTYIALNPHRGVLDGKKDPKTGIVIEEHLLDTGDEVDLDEKVGQKFVDGKSMIEKGGKPTPAADQKEA